MANLTNINKSSADVYLATDAGILIFDDNDNTYLMVDLGVVLEKIIKNLSTLTKILKS
jgi:hypothetical protein